MSTKIYFLVLVIFLLASNVFAENAEMNLTNTANDTLFRAGEEGFRFELGSTLRGTASRIFEVGMVGQNRGTKDTIFAIGADKIKISLGSESLTRGTASRIFEVGMVGANRSSWNSFFKVAQDGRVGIGTDTPIKTLDIKGSVQVLGNQAFSRGTASRIFEVGMVGANRSGTDTLFTVGDDGVKVILDSTTTARGTASRVFEVGMVGQNRGISDTIFTIRDDKIKFSLGTEMLSRGTASRIFEVGMVGANRSSSQPSYIPSFIIKENGFVGINTAAPISPLDVNGDLRISGSGSQLIFPDGSTMSSAGTGSATAISNSNDAVITGDSDANGTGSVILKTGSYSRMTVRNNGNIGIGTTTPTTALDVSGTVKANYFEGNGQNLTGLPWTKNDTITYLTNSNNYIGIGITSPNSKLTLLHNYASTDVIENMIEIYRGSTGTADDGIGAGIAFRNEVSNAGYALSGRIASIMESVYIQELAAGLLFQTRGYSGNLIDGIYINPEGKIGIGTRTPVANLEVRDNLPYAYTGLLLANDAIGYGSMLSFQVNSQWGLPYNVGSIVGTADGDGGRLEFKTHTTNSEAIHMVLEKNGRLGIGTTSPATRLHAVGNENNGTTATIKITGGVDNMLIDGNEIDSDASEGLYLNNNSGENVILANGGGNVGIGTDAPLSHLHIVGSDTLGALTIAPNYSANKNSELRLSESADYTYGMSFLYDGSTNKMHVMGKNGSNSYGPHMTITREGGYVGIGATDPETNLHVSASQASSFHIATIENTQTGTSADILSLKLGTSLSPTSENNFITFSNALRNVGAIEGNGNGGIYFKSGSGDYAEFLPRLYPEEQIEPGEIVGVFEGKITKETRNADKIFVTSTAPIVLGNAPEEEKEEAYEKVAFLGQVKVKVRGTVTAGDYIIPSGLNDGIGVAISGKEITPQQYSQIVGIAWESSDSATEKMVNVAVGMNTPEKAISQLTEIVNYQNSELEKVKTENSALKTELDQLKSEIKIIKNLIENSELTNRKRATLEE